MFAVPQTTSSKSIYESALPSKGKTRSDPATVKIKSDFDSRIESSSSQLANLFQSDVARRRRAKSWPAMTQRELLGFGPLFFAFFLLEGFFEELIFDLDS